jgi:tetratricopeptide (TPR) repeat protein
MLEEWANAEYALGDEQRAHGLWQRAVAEQAQNVSVSALRALERHALQSGDNKSLRQYTQQLSEALEERVSSAAELRLCIRACRRLGVELYAPLMAAEGRIRESWYANELEALALRSDDRLRLYEAMSMQAELARERKPLERAAYALRAAEVLEQSAPARAARELSDALSCAREHPLATEQLARLYKASGDILAAAHTFTRAARSSASPQRALALHYTAAVLFQDELDEPAHAIENLQRAGSLDLLFADTFMRLQLLLKREGRKLELASCIDARLQLPHEPRLGAQLHLERYTLLIEQGALPAAEQALVAALRCDPDASQVLFALGELQLRSGAHRAAAETWKKLIGALDEASERKALADVLVRLGSLQHEHLSDPAAAESSFQRGLALVPDHVETLAALVELYRSQERLPEALKALDTLLEQDPAGSDREPLIIQQAELRERAGDHSGAVDALELAARLAPTSLPLLRAHAQLLQRAGAKDTREAVLLRGCNTLRSEIELDPGELKHWLGLHELLQARGATDAARLVAHAAHALGHVHPELPDTLPHGLGAQALSPAVLTRIAAGGALRAFADLLRTLGPALDPHLPFEHASEPMLGSLVRDYAPAITPQFGLGELHISRCEASLCLPLSAAPLHICVGSAWFDKASDAERTFALLRALALAKLDLTLLTRSTPERLGLVLNALWSVVDRTHMVVVLDATEQNRVAAVLAASIAASELPRTKQLVDAVVDQEEINPRRLQNAALDYGARVALCVTADLWSGLASLLWMRGRLANAVDAQQKIELCRADPALRSLLAFAISEQYAQARSLSNPQPQEPA